MAVLGWLIDRAGGVIESGVVLHQKGYRQTELRRSGIKGILRKALSQRK
jgi:hypothetical protein